MCTPLTKTTSARPAAARPPPGLLTQFVTFWNEAGATPKTRATLVRTILTLCAYRLLGHSRVVLLVCFTIIELYIVLLYYC